MKLTPRQIDVLRDTFNGVRPEFSSSAKRTGYYRVRDDLCGYRLLFGLRRGLSPSPLTAKGLRLLGKACPDLDVREQLAAQEAYEQAALDQAERIKQERQRQADAFDAKQRAQRIGGTRKALCDHHIAVDGLSDAMIESLFHAIVAVDLAS